MRRTLTEELRARGYSHRHSNSQKHEIIRDDDNKVIAVLAAHEVWKWLKGDTEGYVHHWYCKKCNHEGERDTPRCPHCGACGMALSPRNPWIGPDGRLWYSPDDFARPDSGRSNR